MMGERQDAWLLSISASYATFSRSWTEAERLKIWIFPAFSSTR